jgi:hypothetical protein
MLPGGQVLGAALRGHGHAGEARHGRENGASMRSGAPRSEPVVVHASVLRPLRRPAGSRTRVLLPNMLCRNPRAYAKLVAEHQHL